MVLRGWKLLDGEMIRALNHAHIKMQRATNLQEVPLRGRTSCDK